jgi:hypothetical protein
LILTSLIKYLTFKKAIINSVLYWAIDCTLSYGHIYQDWYSKIPLIIVPWRLNTEAYIVCSLPLFHWWWAKYIAIFRLYTISITWFSTVIFQALTRQYASSYAFTP